MEGCMYVSVRVYVSALMPSSHILSHVYHFEIHHDH
jgi:hypothetical protein